MSEEKRSIYRKMRPDEPGYEPGSYVLREEVADEILARQKHLWNVVAPQMLDAMYERLGVPKRLRR